MADRTYRARILTVSTGAYARTREDRSGPEVASVLAEAGFAVEPPRVVPDGREVVSAALRELCEGFSGLVVTTGGTGFAPSDVTPEATRDMLDREAPGLAEAMRSASPKGRLSRGTSGTAGEALVLNLPGSTAAVRECLAAVIDVLPHALALLGGEDAGH